MLRGHRSTFKPTSGSCLDRNNSPLGITQSIGLGENTDAGFTSGDNFTDFELTPAVTIIDVPSDASIVRVYTTAAGKQAACITYSDPCNNGGSFSCPADSGCCPACTTGICCVPETGECNNGICEEDCEGCWTKFDVKASQDDVDAKCEYCGKCACCDEASKSPFCECSEDGVTPPEDGSGALCFSVPGGNCRAVDSCVECEKDPDTFWRCDGPDGCDGGVGACQCREFTGGGGSNTEAECEKANPRCGQKDAGDEAFQCCASGCNAITIAEGFPVVCADGGPGTIFCTEEACNECCASGVTEFFRSNSAYASSVIPAFSTNKKNAGDNLSATQKSILDRGKPTLTTATAINASDTKAYNARLLHANLLDVSAAIQPTNAREIVFEPTGSCDVCVDRKPDNDENVNCGSAIPSMFIAEYNVGELCASLTKVELLVYKVIQTIDGTTEKEELVIIILRGTPKDSSGNSLGNTETLLVDVAESGYIIKNNAQGTIDCDTCGITYDCEGTVLVNGRYPTITSNIEENDRQKYSIPENQPPFLLDGDKLQHIRNSSHTLGERIFSITTTVLGIGSEKEVYTSPADADRIPTITGGPADHDNELNSNITTKLVFDSDAIAAETQGNTYISVQNTGTLQHHYGVPGLGDCAIAGEYATSGEALFAAVFSDTPQS